MSIRQTGLRLGPPCLYRFPRAFTPLLRRPLHFASPHELAVSICLSRRRVRFHSLSGCPTLVTLCITERGLLS